MKSILVMKDLVLAKEFSVAEMSAVRGGINSLIRRDDFCGTRIPRPFPWPLPTGPIVVGPIIVPGDWPLPRY